jgi:DNA-binding NarL/FixJ family response regulator
MIRVLIVDDQRLIRRGLMVLLEDAVGLEVVGEAENGQEALEKVGALQPDVVLMDLQMPVMDGVSATQAIRQRYEAVQVLVLTIDDDDEYVAKALKVGASGYLLKNTPPEDLIQVIHLVHKGYTPLAPGLGQRLADQIPEGALVAPEGWASLTNREREIVRLIGLGLNNDEIAEELVISKSTVKNHITRILQRLNMRDRTQVAILANGR